MTTVLTIFGLIAYFSIGTLFKVYYKLYRHDGILSEEPYIVGLFWPAYLITRIVMALAKFVFYPFVRASAFLEKKVDELQELRELAKQRDKVRVAPHTDRDLRAAEDEVEDYLNREERYRSL